MRRHNEVLISLSEQVTRYLHAEYTDTKTWVDETLIIFDQLLSKDINELDYLDDDADCIPAGTFDEDFFKELLTRWNDQAQETHVVRFLWGNDISEIRRTISPLISDLHEQDQETLFNVIKQAKHLQLDD